MNHVRFRLLGAAVVAGLLFGAVPAHGEAPNEAELTPSLEAAQGDLPVNAPNEPHLPGGDVDSPQPTDLLLNPTNGFALEDLTSGDDMLEGPSRVALPPEFYDPAFERHVDISLVGAALSSRDAALLTDLALQLAEGERVLLRPHHSKITADSLLEKSARLAADRRDAATLDRLARAANKLKNEELAAQIDNLKKLDGASRATDPALSFSLETDDLDVAIHIRELLDAIKEAELIGDPVALDDVETSLMLSGDVSEQQKAAVTKMVSSARGTIGGEISDADDALQKLIGDSRPGRIGRNLRRELRNVDRTRLDHFTPRIFTGPRAGVDYTKIYLRNQTQHPVHVAIHYFEDLPLDGNHSYIEPPSNWNTRGWWLLQPGGRIHVANATGSTFYVSVVDNGRVRPGTHYFWVQGRQVAFQSANFGARHLHEFTLNITP